MGPSTASIATTPAPTISVVVPVYDCPDPEALVVRIEAALDGGGESYEIVLVDDASPSPTIWPALQRLARERPAVRALQLTRNFGQQAATLCGLAHARGEWMLTLDDDLQHDPADLPALLAERAHDIVIGQLVRSEHSLRRRIASRIKARFDEIIVGKPKHLRLSSFRLLGRTVVDGMLSMRTPDPFLPALMFRVSKDVVGVPIAHSRRAAGRSGYTLRKLLRVFAALLINNSSLLLRVVASTGIAFALLSIGLAGLAVFRKLADGTAVAGWTSLFAAVMLIGGLVLMSLGIVGEYLIRIIESSEARPPYFVRRRID
jgi:glycosyltransferase involved in cell wall biosynthesis